MLPSKPRNPNRSNSFLQQHLVWGSACVPRAVFPRLAEDRLLTHAAAQTNRQRHCLFRQPFLSVRPARGVKHRPASGGTPDAARGTRALLDELPVKPL